MQLFFLKKLLFFPIIGGLFFSPLYSVGNHGIGEDLDNNSFANFGFSYTASTIRGGETSSLEQQDLTALEERQLKEAEAERQRQLTIARPVGISIPEIAQGHEEVYRLFYNGKLVYTDPNNTSRKIELPIAALANPLEGTFDLSACGDTGRYLSISTGYRKGRRAANKDKLEIWLAPRFLVERELRSTARHLQPIMDNWPGEVAPIGIFWNGGNWMHLSWYECLTTQADPHHRPANLYDLWLCHDTDVTGTSPALLKRRDEGRRDMLMYITAEREKYDQASFMFIYGDSTNS